jgi:glycine oxidase
MVIDKPQLSACSKIAAGIYNPVVFKRLTKSWMADEILPEMLKFYKSQETNFNTGLITERNIVKLFSEVQEVNLWNKKANGELNNYLDKTIYTDPEYKNVNQNSFGFSKVLRSGNLDMKEFLELTRKYLISKNCFVEEIFDYKELIADDIISYKKHKANHIIFAEGYLVKHNPFFNYIPLKPAKGEILTVHIEDLEIGNDIINKNGFIFSVKPNQFKTGATYNWDDLNDAITEAGLRDLTGKINKIVNCKYKIVNQQAGVRPSAIDRRPVLGTHPKYNKMFVFNGLGTKGVMLAPYFAEQLVQYITKKTKLNTEVDVFRFNKYFVN